MICLHLHLTLTLTSVTKRKPWFYFFNKSCSLCDWRVKKERKRNSFPLGIQSNVPTKSKWSHICIPVGTFGPHKDIKIHPCTDTSPALVTVPNVIECLLQIRHEDWERLDRSILKSLLFWLFLFHFLFLHLTFWIVRGYIHNLLLRMYSFQQTEKTFALGV